ncbi:MAG: M13 family metallopeptidase [SAR202 cluster bacterium]|nr:M13 family metallopeptidase [SAR202 cluster bacterium]
MPLPCPPQTAPEPPPYRPTPIRLYVIGTMETHNEQALLVDRWLVLSEWLAQQGFPVENTRPVFISSATTPPNWLAALRETERVDPWFRGVRAIIARGLGGFAAGGVDAPDGRARAILGDAAYYALTGQSHRCEVDYRLPAFACTWQAQLGALAHEIGHGQGFQHDAGGVMEHWWRWPDVPLVSEEAFAERRARQAAVSQSTDLISEVRRLLGQVRP